MNFRIVDESGKQLAMGRDLSMLQKQLSPKIQSSLATAPAHTFNRDNLTSWNFGDLADRVEVKHLGLTLQGYPALVDQKESVSLRLLDTPDAARAAHRQGLRRLLGISLQPDLKYLAKNLPNIDSLCLNYATLGSCDDLKRELLDTVMNRAAATNDTNVRTAAGFEELKVAVRHDLFRIATEVATLAARILDEYQSTARAIAAPLPPRAKPPPAICNSSWPTSSPKTSSPPHPGRGFSISPDS